MQKPSKEKTKQRTLKNYIEIAGVGVAMGSADIVPGVSGGTMAFILGIYPKLLNSIKAFDFTFIRLLLSLKFKTALEHLNYKFLLSLGLGLGLALISLAHAISWLLEHQPIFLFSFFFGLVLASIVAISTHVRWNFSMILTCLLGTGVAYFTVKMMPLNMPNDPFTLFWCAGLAIMAMILPGISGSFILFILGQYKFILEAVKALNIIALLPVFAGIAVGLILFVRVLSWLLTHFYQLTVTLLVGFMIGSLWKIWPFRIVLETALKPSGEIIPIREALTWPNFLSAEFFIALSLCGIGFILISWLDHLQTKTNPLMKLFIK